MSFICKAIVAGREVEVRPGIMEELIIACAHPDGPTQGEDTPILTLGRARDIRAWRLVIERDRCKNCVVIPDDTKNPVQMLGNNDDWP